MPLPHAPWRLIQIEKRGETMARMLCWFLLSASLVASGCCSVPKYEPAFWNDAGIVQYNNNCYNYGNNKRTDSYAQPGRAAGAQYTAVICAEVQRAALADGLRAVPATGQCPSDSHNQYCKIAFAVGEIYPGQRDYHWYRQDQGGMWSHKPGGGTARNVDHAGSPIADPQTADRDGYTDFCGYLCTCSDSAQGNGHAKIN